MNLKDRLYFHRFCCEQNGKTIYETPLIHVIKLEKRSTRKTWFRYRTLKLKPTKHVSYYEFLKYHYVPTRTSTHVLMKIHDREFLIRIYIQDFITKEQLDDLVGYEVIFHKFKLNQI